MEKVPYLGETLFKWHSGRSTFLAMPERGARLMNWHITLGDGSVRDIVYWPELGSLDGFQSVRGGNPLLFPFCGRTFDQGKIYQWRDPAGVSRPMPMHGIARQSSFKVTRLDARGFAAQLMPDAEARACYPYDYEFVVTYRFEPLGLACEMTLRNLGSTPIPWCAGHHFYFTLPWSEGTSRDDYLIRIPAAKTLRQDLEKDGRMLPGPVLKPDESLANPELINTFHTGLRSNKVVFGEKGRAGDIQVTLGSARVPPPDACFVTWTMDEQSPFYCVEPWMGTANPIENKLGLRWVAPGQTDSFTVEVTIK